MHFEITESQRRDGVSLQIVGELDVLTAPRLAAELGSVLRRSEADLIVDLRQAEFIDSAGLQLLLGIQRQLSRASRKLRVVCNPGAVRRVIELARLEEILGLTAGEDEAPR